MCSIEPVEIATFGAGCFWGVQKLFDDTPGVKHTEAGYMGGDEKKYPKPKYEEVCSDETGYAEVVQIAFNPKQVEYETLLKIFWEHHDPTTPDRQGPDYGSQYRSVVFYYSSEQKEKAEKVKKEVQKYYGKTKVVTEIVSSGSFIKAEEYHQTYLEKKGIESCHLIRKKIFTA
jgi:peptide-methionine (S)-S-oxide reductase